VRSTGGNEHDVAGLDVSLLVSDPSGGPAFLKDQDLVVGMRMERGSLSRRRVDEEERDPRAALVVSDELAREDAQRQLVLSDDVDSGLLFRLGRAYCEPNAAWSAAFGTPAAA
jgi:hypothetical protein